MCDAGDASWYFRNLDLIAEADSLISQQLADRKRFCDHTGADMLKICDVVFNNILNQGSENNSVLLLGEAGSGKTHIAEWCLKELRKARPSTLVLRARGSAYNTDVECLRHLAAQMTDKLGVVPHTNASFKDGIEWIRNIFKSSFNYGAAMVMVLDQFEYFAFRSRQTLLYNLFDIAQEAGVHLSIIGTSEKIDVMDSLEKRIRSRFSMRHLHTFLPTTMEGLVQVLMAKLKLPAAQTGKLKAPFVPEFNRRVEAALRSKKDEWKHHLELGRPPSWFLARCVPVASLLHSAEVNPVANAPKRARLTSVLPGSMPSATDSEVTMLLLEGLSEAEHIMLLALYRLHGRGLPRTLRIALHEIQLLHENGAFGVADAYDTDTYSTAFGLLVQLQLVEIVRPAGSATLAKRHLPCKSVVDHVYAELIGDLGAARPTYARNPLRALPSRLQQWAARQRPVEPK